MFHLSAWYQSINPAGALVPILAVQDPVLMTTLNDVRVPQTLPNVIGAAGLINDASAARIQLQSPSLRIRANLDIEPFHNGLVFGNPSEINFWPDTPSPVVANESLNMFVQSAPAGAVVHQAFAFLSDGPQQPVAGNIFTVRVTGAATLVAGSWVNTNITFQQVLPAGTFAVVGMRARGTNLVAARLVFPNQIPRPGVLAVNAFNNVDPYWPRFGRMGSWGQFDNTVPPTVDCFGVTDTTQVFLLDLIQVK